MAAAIGEGAGQADRAPEDVTQRCPETDIGMVRVQDCYGAAVAHKPQRQFQWHRVVSSGRIDHSIEDTVLRQHGR